MKHPFNRLSRSGAGGFTLLELLAAVAILVIVSGLLFGAFDQASKAWLQAENRVETSLEARAALEMLSRELSQATLTTNYMSFSPPVQPLLKGDADSVTFVAPTDSEPPDKIITYQLDKTKFPYSLNRAVAPYLGGNISKLGVDVDGVIAENILEICFSNTVDGLTWAKNAQPSGVQVPRAVFVGLKVIDSRAVARFIASGSIASTVTNTASKNFYVKIAISSR